MVHLRFLQEYRGHRIVTDGKLFGVERDQAADFRYLSVFAAKAAVNSQLAIEAKRRDDENCRRFSVESVEYFENYQTRGFACECGWRGCYHDLKPVRSCCSFVVTCPTCQHPLLSVHPPSCENVKDAGARGDEGALAMLPSVLASEKADHASWTQALKDTLRLLELCGDALSFALDIEHRGDGDFFIITLAEHAEQYVWRELAHVGDRRRFYELKRFLKKEVEEKRSCHGEHRRS